MLTKQNQGKYADKDWHEKREQYIKDDTMLTDYEKDYYEISATEGKGSVYDDESYQANTTPVDAETESRRYDIRRRRTAGGDGQI